MIRINLLPVREERRKADLRQFGVVLAGVLVGSLLLVGLYHMKLSSDVSDARATVASTQQQIDRFKPQLKQLEEYRKTKAEIEAKLEVIERLDASRSGPVRMFDELATHAPPRLWLTKLEAEAGQLRIDNELVALFLTALNESVYFDNVELRETTAKEMSGYKLNEFALSATLVTPRPAKKTTPDGAIASIGTAG
jgi:type IV pilus assembly protein PilN